MRGHSLCGWVEKPELSSLFGSCILSTIPGIYHWYQSYLFLPCGGGNSRGAIYGGKRWHCCRGGINLLELWRVDFDLHQNAREWYQMS